MESTGSLDSGNDPDSIIVVAGNPELLELVTTNPPENMTLSGLDADGKYGVVVRVSTMIKEPDAREGSDLTELSNEVAGL